MAKVQRIDQDAPRRYQWVTDGGENEILNIGPCGSILVEIKGLKHGQIVNLRGGLTNADTLMAVARADGVETLPAVRMLRPETGESGITVTFMGVQ